MHTCMHTYIHSYKKVNDVAFLFVLPSSGSDSEDEVVALHRIRSTNPNPLAVVPLKRWLSYMSQHDLTIFTTGTVRPQLQSKWPSTVSGLISSKALFLMLVVLWIAVVTDHFRSKRITAAGLMTSPWPRAIKVRSCDRNRIAVVVPPRGWSGHVKNL